MGAAKGEEGTTGHAPAEIDGEGRGRGSVGEGDGEEAATEKEMVKEDNEIRVFWIRVKDRRRYI